jgi:isoleucyl-tRNA synthetase
LGADILRLWIASSDYRYEMTVSNEIIARIADGYRRIRNTARFLLSNLKGSKPEQALPISDLVALDKWVIHRANQIQQEIITAYESYQFHQIIHLVQNFCSGELGSFYLDIIKDRQYTAKAGGQAHRSVQTAMYHLLQAMVRWIAPVLSFTADELYEAMQAELSLPISSVFTLEWYEGLSACLSDSAMDTAFWQKMMQVRDGVNKQMEVLRNEGKINGSLTAEVTMIADETWSATLAELEDELRFVLITSSAKLLPMAQMVDSAVVLPELAGVAVLVTPTEQAKCDRCWHHRADVGSHAGHESICGRCVENIEGEGEVRRYA